jgi:hypothetical protein
MNDDPVGSWQPDGGATLPGVDDLRALAAVQRAAGDAAPSLPDDAALVERARAAMSAPAGALDAAIEALDADELVALVHLFTLIEAQPGWEAGARSPVIPLFRRYRELVDVETRRALVAWVKARSENRFLPHGSLQDRL